MAVVQLLGRRRRPQGPEQGRQRRTQHLCTMGAAIKLDTSLVHVCNGARSESILAPSLVPPGGARTGGDLLGVEEVGVASGAPPVGEGP